MSTRPPPMSPAEAGLRIAIAADPRDTVARLTYRDWLQEGADSGDPLAKLRLDLILVGELIDPHEIKPWDPRHNSSAVVWMEAGRQFAYPSTWTAGRMALPGGEEDVSLAYLLEREREIFNRMPLMHLRHVTCLACDGFGRCMVEKEEPEGLFSGTKRLYAEPEYVEDVCPRCGGLGDEGGLVCRNHGGAVLDWMPTITVTRGHVSGVRCGVSDLWDRRNKRPKDWLVRACLWNPIEHVRVHGGADVFEATEWRQLLASDPQFRDVRPARILEGCRLLAKAMASDAIM